jgi:uncharacterized membrane protein
MNTTLTAGFDGGRSDDGRAAVARTAGLVSMAVLAVGLGGLALGIGWAWVAFPVGYGGVLPLAIGWAKSRARSESADGRSQHDRDDPLATLRERYARGEIDDVEFERRVERLVETEDGPGR